MGQKVTVSSLKSELKKHANEKRAKASMWFFKTAKGQYGYGDVFLGVSVPVQRKVAKQFLDLDLPQIQKLLSSPIHELRLTAVFILVDKYKKADSQMQKQIFEFYLSNTKYINNWDIVDSSAPYIVGNYLQSKNLKIDVLKKLARSKLIWDRRIAIMSTFAFTIAGNPKPTFLISEILLQDQHDLIQKAVGWMLREVGKRIDQPTEEEFLLGNGRYKTMPRTMLRYAIERFPQNIRKQYLLGTA